MALGSGSVTGARNALTSITINGNEVGNNGQESGTSVLAVGNSTSARQVQYVSAGLISATSTDAINGSQRLQRDHSSKLHGKYGNSRKNGCR